LLTCGQAAYFVRRTVASAWRAACALISDEVLPLFLQTRWISRTSSCVDMTGEHAWHSDWHWTTPHMCSHE
jgi:hypothetical protein